ncbi:VOC family protein [Nocardioides caldifontis]|uniref:VOC family protein n=1 Tax=Nocardioides caldifontis TaxID=2588938 RepID=UPI0011E04947|nr:VOC family protein [Nocardioides caldifontis]
MALELFAGVPVSDFARAVAWYERLLGGPATFEAHPTEQVWTLAEHCHVYVVLDPGRAGRALVTLFVDDLDEVVRGAAARGVEPDSRETYGNGVRKVHYLDPDGNEIGFGGAPLESDG